MRIIAFSDIHGAHEVVQEILEHEHAFDVVVIAGDFTTKGTTAEVESAVGEIRSHHQPVVAVAGNMDPPSLELSLSRLGVAIDSCAIAVGDAAFFGVSASPFTPFHTPYELSEEEIMRRAEEGWKQVLGAKWKIFVPHAPPRDTSLDRTFVGRHVGSISVRRFIEARQPDVAICGHIHEARGVDSIGRTQIVNCGPAGRGNYAVIALGPGITIDTRG
jgi:Icc-related predicted phosphoesterase